MRTVTEKFSWIELIKSIWYFVDEDKRKYVFAFSILLFVFFCDLLPVYVVGKIVDFFTDYNTGESLSPFYWYVLFITIVYIVTASIRLASKKILNIIGQNSRTRARVWGFERLTEFSLEWHNKENTGNKLQRIFTGADGVQQFLKLISKDLLKIFANIIGVVVIFLFTDIKFVILIIIYIILFLYIEFTLSRKIFALSNEFNALNQGASGVYVEGASNMLAIKALGRADTIVKRVQDRETLSRNLAIKRININNLKWRLFQYLNGVTLGIFLLIVGFSLISRALTVGMVLVFYTYFNGKLQGSLAEITELHTDMIENNSNVMHMMPIFKETEFIKTGNEKFPLDWQAIEIRNAEMNYGSGQMGLSNFNLVLNRNTKTGIAGLSGSGKSTLAKTILGLYALRDGVFKIGKESYYNISHNETLAHITVVLQETELFNLTLRENITMMRPEDKELLNRAVEISELGEVIKRLPEGLDSRIGEKGYMLSGGERQRLGIARAIYKNAPIIILDEATSSLDSETEGKIMQKLLDEYGKDKTFLIIAHRLGTLKYTDTIAVMERGQVVEEGSYEKLMNDSSSVFYRMNKEQKHISAIA